ncbi:MAG: serine/threonine-protein kinase [Myxococcota bacterium]
MSSEPTAATRRDAAPAPAAGLRSTFGPYEVLGRLARESRAELFLAREPGSGDTVVLRTMLPHVLEERTEIDTFFADARLAATLQHPAIEAVRDFGEESGTHYLALDWVDGVSLAELMARTEGPLPVAIAVHIAATVAHALHYAHELVDADGRALRVVHRGLGPRAVMLTWAGEVKLRGFGRSRAQVQQRRTHRGPVKGNFGYMSPQQCAGEVVDGRADVFALGVMLWECLAGRPLFRRAGPYLTMRAVVHDEVPELPELRPEVPPELDAIVRTAIAKEPSARWSSAEAFGQALERWLAKQADVVLAGRVAALLAETWPGVRQAGPRLEPVVVPEEGLRTAPGLKAVPEPEAPAFPTPAVADPDELSFPPMHQPSYLPPPPPASGTMRAFELFATPNTGNAPLPGPPPKPPARLPAVAALLGLVVAFGAAAYAVGRPEGAAVAPATGALFVDSLPAGAAVRVDGEPRGVTPLRLEGLAPGARRIEVTLAGHRAERVTLEVRAGEQTAETLALAPE